MAEQERESSTQLAAIVFTDIAGYSRMMEEDEQRTIAILRRHNGIILPLIEQHGGEVIDAIGDGLFVLFSTLRDATTCAVTIQHAIAAHNRGAAEHDWFRVRIGVHLGEIWREGERVYGNGVNIAARIQPHAEPGGVCITEDVYRQVANKVPYEIRSIGRHELRNISRKLELYQVVTGHESGSDLPCRGGELDAIKQRILDEREEIARRRRESGDSASASSLEKRIESKVFSLVERVMDAAVTKWDELPQEKKARLMSRLEAEIDAKSNDLHVRVQHARSDGDEPVKETRELLSVGFVISAALGVGHFAFGVGWMIWPFLFLGVLPLSIGILKAISLIGRTRRAQRDRPAECERSVLAAARRLGGTVTVVQVAFETGLSVDDVQHTLDRLTAKGYVSQHVQDSGIVIYEFPSLGPGATPPSSA